MQRFDFVFNAIMTWAGTVVRLVCGVLSTLAGLIIVCHDLVVLSKTSSVFWLTVSVAGGNIFWAFVGYMTFFILMGPLMIRSAWRDQSHELRESLRDDLARRREAA